MILQPIHEVNDCHAPAGSPAGGQFCATPGASTAPKTKGRTPNPTVQAEANRYTAAHGRPPVQHPYVELDQTRAGRIADAYDALPVDDSRNPEVVRSYQALATEVQAQWAHATANGMRFEPWTQPGQPYATSGEMLADVRANRHLYFYTGGDPNPVMAVKDPATGYTVNDMFRAVHDYYGHSAGGYSFGPRGEENAWIAHSQMFSPEARRALTTETRGQNSWVNFGRQNFNPDGSYKNIPPANRPYATQKYALLPVEFSQTPLDERKIGEAQPPVRKPIVLPEEGDHTPYPPPPPRKDH